MKCVRNVQGYETLRPVRTSECSFADYVALLVATEKEKYDMTSSKTVACD